MQSRYIIAIAAAIFTVLSTGLDATSVADVLDMNLEELMNVPVHAASGFEQRTAEAPSSVTILTRDDLRNFGCRTLADALASVAGFYTTYDRTYDTLGVRGFNRPGDYNTRTLVLINGARVNDPIFSTGRVGTDFPLDLDLIERIEVVRGPSSSLYGSSAFFAVINVVTREAEDIAPAEAALSAGSYDAFSGRFSVAQLLGEKGSLLVSGSLMDSVGNDLYFPLYDSPANDNGMTEGLDGEHTGSLFILSRYDNWKFQTVYLNRCKDSPTASYGTIFGDPGSKNCDRETMIDLSWEDDVAEGWAGMVGVGYQRYAYGGDWPYDVSDPGEPAERAVYKDEATSESVCGEIRVISDVIPDNRISIGTKIRHAFRLDQRYGGEGGLMLDSEEYRTDLGLYLQDEIRLLHGVLANLGLRYDHVEPYGDTELSPRIAMILSPASNSVFKLVYGQAFRAPNAFELYYEDGESIKSNPDLESELIHLYEVVWEQRIAECFQLNTSLYRYHISDLITQVTDPEDGFLVFRNLESVEAFGGDIEGRLELPRGIHARGSYSYCRTRDLDTHEQLSNSPEHMAKLNVLTPVIFTRLTAGLELQYIGDRLTVAREEVNDFMILNATLQARRLPCNFDLSLSVYNVFDKDYADPVGEEIEGGIVTQDGRTFMAKVTRKF